MSMEVENSAIERWAASRFGLGCLLQRRQVGGPEPIEELLHREQSVGAREAIAALTPALIGTDPRSAAELLHPGALQFITIEKRIVDATCIDQGAVDVARRSADASGMPSSSAATPRTLALGAAALQDSL